MLPKNDLGNYTGILPEMSGWKKADADNRKIREGRDLTQIIGCKRYCFRVIYQHKRFIRVFGMGRYNDRTAL
jgi:hypothetical protein